MGALPGDADIYHKAKISSFADVPPAMFSMSKL